MKAPSLAAIFAAMRQRGYAVFNDASGYNVNIVGIRSGAVVGDRYDDLITLSYRIGKAWAYFAFPATTDPGTYFRHKPINVAGTAILKPGQYRRAFRIGRHGGYDALIQTRAVTVYRDGNRDGRLDTHGQPEQTGMFGINIHRASEHPETRGRIGRWSAGCQVFQVAAHFDFFMRECDAAAAKYGNAFTYTLLDERDLAGGVVA